MARKPKLPGENISFKTSVNEDSRVMEWINSQSNLTDSIRYLIEQDICQHGLRNLQRHIPSVRSLDGLIFEPAKEEIAVTTDHQQTTRSKVTDETPVVQQASPSEEVADPQHEDEEISDEDVSSWA